MNTESGNKGGDRLDKGMRDQGVDTDLTGATEAPVGHRKGEKKTN